MRGVRGAGSGRVLARGVTITEREMAMMPRREEPCTRYMSPEDCCIMLAHGGPRQGRDPRFRMPDAPRLPFWEVWRYDLALMWRVWKVRRGL